MGKFLSILILTAALIGGGAMYYLQVYGYYDQIDASGPDDVLAVTLASGLPEPMPHAAFQAIDSDSSPIRYRACFRTSLTPDEIAATYQPYPRAVPLLAPKWFDCFDAREIGAALEDGSAQAVMGVENIRYGIDRVIAVMPDGRGFVWHQINRCGAVVFDGQPAPDDCPPPPEGN
ncbi:MAG: DUF6446 family protein [Rhodobacterales bacterium]